MSYANGHVDKHCAITDSMTVGCNCPDDPDELRKYLHGWARHLEEQGPDALDVPHEWRGLRRFLREQRYTP